MSSLGSYLLAFAHAFPPTWNALFSASLSIQLLPISQVLAVLKAVIPASGGPQGWGLSTSPPINSAFLVSVLHTGVPLKDFFRADGA